LRMENSARDVLSVVRAIDAESMEFIWGDPRMLRGGVFQTVPYVKP
jgi:hypothetical protein